MMNRISLKAYAKVNLSLDVTGKLDNGYHTLRSVMQAVNLFDEITVSLDESTDFEVKLNLSCDGAFTEANSSVEGEIPLNNDNLACKAAAKMIEYFKPEIKSLININLNKKIPVAAGLAGGSTDAAAVMLALAYLWNIKPDLLELIGIAKTIGADVPFCLISNAKNNSVCGFDDEHLASSAALAEGIGENLTPLPSLAGHLIFVKPLISLSTPVVYSLYDERKHLVKERPDTESLINALTEREKAAFSQNLENMTDSLDIIKTNMINVLEPIVRSEYPFVTETLDTLKDIIHDAKIFMSGSGPTVVAFFERSKTAIDIMPAVERLFCDKAGIYTMKLL